jgi:hypothetical protein
MLTRRELACFGVAAAALARNALAHASSLAPARRLDFDAVLVDRGSAASTAFAAEASRRGVPLGLIDGDLAPLWMSAIEPRWRTAPAAIAGLCGAGTLFCLELFARDHRLRIAYRAEHAREADGRIAHRVDGADVELATRALAAAGERWSTVAAALALSLRRSDDAPAVEPLDYSMRASQSLYSWVIAPR